MIANDHRRSQRDLFPYNRRRSQTIAEPTIAIHFVQRNVIRTRALCSRENQSKQHGGHRGGNFAASKFISSFSPKATTSQLQNLRIRKTFMKRQDKLNFSSTFSQLLDFFMFVFEILTITVVNALIPRNYVQCQPSLKQMSVAIIEHSGYGLEALNHRSELKIL